MRWSKTYKQLTFGATVCFNSCQTSNIRRQNTSCLAFIRTCLFLVFTLRCNWQYSNVTLLPAPQLFKLLTWEILLITSKSDLTSRYSGSCNPWCETIRACLAINGYIPAWQDRCHLWCTQTLILLVDKSPQTSTLLTCKPCPQAEAFPSWLTWPTEIGLYS